MDGDYLSLSVRRYARLRHKWDRRTRHGPFGEQPPPFTLLEIESLQAKIEGWAYVTGYEEKEDPDRSILSPYRHLHHRHHHCPDSSTVSLSSSVSSSSASSVSFKDDIEQAMHSLLRHRWLKFRQPDPMYVQWFTGKGSGHIFNLPIDRITSAVRGDEPDRLRMALAHPTGHTGGAPASLLLLLELELGSALQLKSWLHLLEQRTYLHRWLGHFEKELGRGGFAQVSLHRHRTNPRGPFKVVTTTTTPEFMAVKKFDGETLTALRDMEGMGGRYRQELEQIERECRLTCAMRHPNLVRGYGYRLAPVPQLAMEFCPEGDLRLAIESQWNVPLTMKFTLALDVLRALRYLHGHGLVHRDVKSSNIFLCHAPVVAKLGDFGLMCHRVPLAVVQRPNRFTPEYASLQMMESVSERAEPCDDLFSFGTVWWEMVEWRTVERWVFAGEYHAARERLRNRQTPHSFVSCTQPWLQKISILCWEAPWRQTRSDDGWSMTDQVYRVVSEEAEFLGWVAAGCGRHGPVMSPSSSSTSSSSSSGSSRITTEDDE